MSSAIEIRNGDKALAGARILRKDGRSGGTRYNFVGKASASTLRDQGKLEGLKGAKLSAWVNAQLTGEQGKASGILAAAAVASWTAAGGVFTHADITPNGNGITLKGAMPKTGESAEAKEAKRLAAENAEYAKQIAELRAQLGK